MRALLGFHAMSNNREGAGWMVFGSVGDIC